VLLAKVGIIGLLSVCLELFGTGENFVDIRTEGYSKKTADTTCLECEVQAPVVQDEIRPRMGISSEKPSSGQFVELSDGTFMVPYTEKIPGTSVEFTMVPIPGGKFMLGSPESEGDRSDDEGPQVEVTVEPFWMGKYEVTWEEYQKYMKMETLYTQFHALGKRCPIDDEVEGLDAITAPSSLYDPSFTFAAGGDPRQPAATISQFAAKQYTKWLSLMLDDFYRLPYEAEWEYACRAGTTTAYYFGDDPDELEDHAWIFENSDDSRQDVGQKKANPWGLFDMYGNVAEWALDQYSEDGYTHIKGNSVTAKESFNKPKTVDPRVVRGGSYLSEPDECRSASRLGSEKSWRGSDPNIPQSPWWYTDEPATGVGFRLLRPLNELSREEKESFWSADVERIMYEARSRIQDNGRGKFGTVDPQLPEDIKSLSERKQD
jgi:formylglycine-generating enzyme required for sulfatase activity